MGGNKPFTNHFSDLIQETAPENRKRPYDQISSPLNDKEGEKTEDPQTPQKTNSICIEQDSPDARPRNRIKADKDGKAYDSTVDDSDKKKVEDSFEATVITHEHLKQVAEIIQTIQGACFSITHAVNMLDLLISSKNHIEDGRKNPGKGLILSKEGLSIPNEPQELLNTIEPKSTSPRANLDTCSSIALSTEKVEYSDA